MKKLSFIFLFFGISLISCKEVEVVKLPNPNCSSGKCYDQYAICSSDLSRPGISEARETFNSQTQSYGQCIIASCDPTYNKENLKKWVDENKPSDCIIHENCSNNLTENHQNDSNMTFWEIIISLSEQYPNICIPQEIECESASVIDGEGHRLWLGLNNILTLKVDKMEEQTAETSPMNLDADTILNFGFTPCEPKTENSCSEGYTYYLNSSNHQAYCYQTELDCTWYMQNVLGQPNASSATVMFNTATGNYETNTQCMIQSCQSGYMQAGNSCIPAPPTDPCILNPMMCDPCFMNPNLPSCPI